MCQDVADSVIFYIQRNSSFCINCPLSGSSIQWRIDNVRVADITPPLNYSVSSDDNSLLMHSSQPGTYQCRNENSDTHQFMVTLSGSAVEHVIMIMYGINIILPVLEDLPPFINDPTVYNENDDVSITCRNDATPAPRSITWLRNSVQIADSALLIITSIQRSASGNYTCCTTSRIAGESVMTCREFTLTVQCELLFLLEYYHIDN